MTETLSRFSAPAFIFSSTSSCCVNSSNFGQYRANQAHTVAVFPTPVGLEVGLVVELPLLNVLNGLDDFPVPSLSPLRRERKLAFGVV